MQAANKTSKQHIFVVKEGNAVGIAFKRECISAGDTFNKCFNGAEAMK